MPKRLFLIIIFAFLLRLVSLNQSLWLDEAISASVVKNYSYLDIVTKFSPSDFHPPFYYLVLKTWTSVFGLSEISLRFPSVLSSLATGYFIYLIGALQKNKNTGLWASSFFLFNPLVIYYSQETRMYSLVTLFLTISLYSYLTNRKKLFNLFTFLSLITFYGSIFFIISILFWQLIKSGFKKTLPFVFGSVIALILLFPLLSHQYLVSKTMTITVPNWSLVLGKANIKNLLMIPLKFAFGRISFYPKTTYYLLSCLWTVIVFTPTIFSASKFFALIFLLPLAIAFFISFSSPMLQYFRYLYLVPVLGLLLSRISNRTVKITIVSGFTLLSLIYLLSPQFHREDWKSLASSLPPNSAIYMVPSFSDPITYYRPDIAIKDIQKVDSRSTENITVAPYGLAIHGIDLPSTLSPLGYTQSSAIVFRELSLEFWQPSPSQNPASQ